MATEHSSKMTLTTPSDLEIVLTREFAAPRELVFRIMTDPEFIPRWWCPAKYSTRVDIMDVRPGGKWRFVNTGPDGEEIAFRGEYREITPPARIVQTFEFEPLPGHISIETGVLEEKDGKTLFTGTSLFESKEDRDGMLNSGMEGGAAETYDRLEQLLTELS